MDGNISTVKNNFISEKNSQVDFDLLHERFTQYNPLSIFKMFTMKCEIIEKNSFQYRFKNNSTFFEEVFK